jgi:hypothetical protein
MGGCAESEEADAVSFLDAGDAKAAEADNSGAEERGGVKRVERGGDGEDEIGASEGVFGVASVDGVAGESGGVAEVFVSAKAVRANSIGAAEPGDADERCRRKLRRVGHCRCRASLDRTGEDARPHMGGSVVGDLLGAGVVRCLVGQECPTHTGGGGFRFYDLADDLVAGNYLLV